ncbi:MAG TPA: class III extradiol ring-cleavage dioxygenase [Dongiaceae bacterium]|nr:class III extradiol ring-cleavage dioxygenase [Dongiaceae bacterium]
MSSTQPVLYLPHGGGPMPLLGEPSHQELVAFLQQLPQRLGQPKAILLISAHWETAQPTLTSAPQPALFYDYYGFPPESYSITYPAPGDPALAQQIADLLRSAGFDPQLDGQRGFDHGMFIPLKLLFPTAQIPVVQLSLLQSLDPAAHIALGKALAPLREQGVLIIGSGMSFHNMHAFFHTADSEQGRWAREFDQWLIQSCCDPQLSAAQREQRLAHWQEAPHARYSHPREEHLLPLQVCFGAALATSAEAVFHGQVLGKTVVAFLWS